MNKRFIRSMILVSGLLTATSFAQTDGTASLAATLGDYPGNGDDHWTVVWVTTSSGTFIKTIWKQGPSSFTSNHWRDHCNIWYAAKGTTNNAFDGYTSATARNYSGGNNPVTASWDGRDESGVLMPDGNYKFWIQYSEDDESNFGPVTTNGLQWTKGPAASSPGYPNQGSTPNFSNLSVSWVPVVLPEPEIAVEQPAGSDMANGASRNFGSVTIGSDTSLIFTIKNTGDANLTGLTISKTGVDSGDFTVTSSPSAPLSGPNGTTTFTVQFTPHAAGIRTAVIHIANNDGDENPFDINLSGTGVTAFDAWAAAASLPPGEAGADDTPQGDGVSNLLKFGCNLEPTMPDARTLSVGDDDKAGLPGGIMVEGGLRLEYLRRKATTSPGITYTPQFSSDLGIWSDFSGPETVTSIDTTWERVVIDDVPPPGATNRYGRLKILLTP